MTEAAPPYWEHRIEAADGLSLYVRDYGHDKTGHLPLLCLAGITRNSKDYHRLALRYAASRRVVVPDYRGRGQSGWDTRWENYVPTVYLGDIARIMAGLGLDRVVVVGTSLGGLLAMALRALNPRAVAAIVLNDIGPQLEAAGTQDILTRIGQDRTHPDWASAARYLAAEMPTLLIHSDAGWLDLAHRLYRQGPDGYLHVDWDTRIAQPLLRNIEPTPDLWEIFRMLRHVPVLVIRGGASELLSEATLDRMIAVKPDLLTVTIPGVGHAPSLDEPEALGALDDFIARF